jgi:RNA polymerase sigma-70 factor (ECF subfamily)
LEGVIARPSARLDADAFRALYDRTARPLRAYLWRLIGDQPRADDLLQETYLRLLGADLPADMSDEHLKNYVFRIATNLSRDEHRRHRPEQLNSEHPGSKVDANLRLDMATCLERMDPKQRELLWLAYVEQFSHAEIGSIVGAKPQSVRPMLARARHRLGEILKTSGFSFKKRTGETHESSNL